MRIWIAAVVAFLAAPGNPVLAQQVSTGGVKRLSPGGAVKPTGTWNAGTRAGDFIFVAGMRGIDPKTNSLVQGDGARVRQAFLNMKLIAESEGATLRDTVRLVVYVTDMFRFRPLVNNVQEELWARVPIRRAPSSRSIASTRTTSSRSRGPSTRRKRNKRPRRGARSRPDRNALCRRRARRIPCAATGETRSSFRDATQRRGSSAPTSQDGG
jgi:2-iminobutanoate/2-iminopropanoate deaminase